MIREVRVRLLAVLVISSAVVVVARVGVLTPGAAELFADSAQVVAGVIATWSCVWTARSHTGLQRTWRLFMSVAMAGWTVASAVVAVHRPVAGSSVPGSTLSDLGFGTAFFFALLAMLLFTQESRRSSRRGSLRGVHTVAALDGLVVVGALSALTWSTVLGAVIRETSSGTARHMVAVAYPVGDLILASVVLLLVVTRRVHDRFLPQLWLAGAGVLLLSVCDSILTFLATADGIERPVLSTCFGFVLGPALIACAALTSAGDDTRTWVPRFRAATQRAHLLMPYGFVVLAAAAVVGRFLGGGGVDVIGMALVWAVVVAVLIRQIVMLLENKALLEQLSTAQSELAYRAHHDPLTGLANRTLLGLRLTEAMDFRRRSGQGFAVLLIDLDDFKSVNDSLGHAAGDLLLQVVGDRLRGCVRAQDTVCRLGGDEFVVILAGGGTEPRTVAHRIVAVLGEQCVIDGRVLAMKASVGIVEPGYEPGLTPEILLHRADGAMYAGKRLGKSVIVAYDASGQSILSGDTDIIPR